MKQSSFAFNKNFKPEFGGSLLLGKRKAARPLATKSPMHFVLKSEKACKNLSFINHRCSIERVIADVSKKFHVKLYAFAVNFNHIHLVIQLPHRSFYKKWIRSLTAAIVLLLSTRTKQKLKEFFTLRPYSVIVSWGKQFKRVMDYQIKNQMELFGIFRPKKGKRVNCQMKSGRIAKTGSLK